MQVKLESARVGHRFDDNGRFAGVFAQAAGAVVEMKDEEAMRYREKGLASEVEQKKPNK